MRICRLGLPFPIFSCRASLCQPNLVTDIVLFNRPLLLALARFSSNSGSVGALVILPLVTVLTRKNIQQVEAWTFFAGSVGSLLITLWFLQVL